MADDLTTFEEDDDIPAYNPDTGLTEAMPQPSEGGKKRRKRRTKEEMAADGEAVSFAEGKEPRKRRSSKDLEETVDALRFAHSVAGRLLNDPDILLSEDEAQKLAGALAKVAPHFNISLDGKTKLGAILGLGYVATLIYGPRAFMLIQRIRETGSVKLPDDIADIPSP
jgi:hypothetical protein